MKLYDMLDKSVYYQEVWVIETNAYDQNLPIFKGTVDDARTDDFVWTALMEEVEMFEFVSGVLAIKFTNKYYNERLETQYSNPKWGKDIKDRPWLYSSEVRGEIEKWKTK